MGTRRTEIAVAVAGVGLFLGCGTAKPSGVADAGSVVDSGPADAGPESCQDTGVSCPLESGIGTGEVGSCVRGNQCRYVTPGGASFGFACDNQDQASQASQASLNYCNTGALPDGGQVDGGMCVAPPGPKLGGTLGFPETSQVGLSRGGVNGTRDTSAVEIQLYDNLFTCGVDNSGCLHQAIKFGVSYGTLPGPNPRIPLGSAQPIQHAVTQVEVNGQLKDYFASQGTVTFTKTDPWLQGSFDLQILDVEGNPVGTISGGFDAGYCGYLQN